MRKILKITAGALGALLLVLVVAGFFMHKPLPEGASGPQAEALADSMLVAINYKAYDTLREIRWSYPSGHHYIWNKRDNKVNVRWEAYEVDLNLDSLTGTAYKKSVKLSGNKAEDAVWKAWKLFANDSFWLVAPFKIRDPGTRRLLIKTQRGDALLVTYTSGGVTPGDSYLWILDKHYRPVAWRLWVKIIPVGGVEFSWQGWHQQKNVWFAPDHAGPGPLFIALKDLHVE